MVKRKTELIKLKKGRLPSKKVVDRFFKLRKAGFSIADADRLSRIRLVKKK